MTDTAATGTTLADVNLSYAYAQNCTENTAVEICLMTEQSGATKDAEPWVADLSADAFRNHGDEGVNALYIDGHVVWVNENEITKKIPNCTAPAGDEYLRNPGSDG